MDRYEISYAVKAVFERIDSGRYDKINRQEIVEQMNLFQGVGEMSERICNSCFCIFSGNAEKCPVCGCLHFVNVDEDETDELIGIDEE